MKIQIGKTAIISLNQDEINLLIEIFQNSIITYGDCKTTDFMHDILREIQ